MEVNRTSIAPELKHSLRNHLWLWISALATMALAGSELVALWVGGNHQLWAVLPVFLAAPLVYWLLRRGKRMPGNMVFIAAISLQAVFSALIQAGSGVPNAIIYLVLICGLCLTTLPRKYFGRVLLGGLLLTAASICVDLFGSPSRPLAEPAEGRWVYSLVMLVLFVIFFAQELLSLDLRAKIALGILSTGGIALGVLVFFALYQTQITSGFLERRLEASVGQLAEEQLRNTAFTEANRANQSFEEISQQVTSLAQNWVALWNRREVLGHSAFWNASTSLSQLDGGQYGNSPRDASSVFIPAGTELDPSLISDLNVSAFLDFYAPGILQAQSSLLAIYAIDTRGVTRYYPNINLASLLSPDFDATKRPYFSITTPLFDPQRRTRWAIPYMDATGGGLVVTVTAPVYHGDTFSGIVAADMQLSQITKQISAIKVGRTGYAFLIDDAGRILSMPPAGFKMLGIRPEDLNSEEFFKQTILGAGSPELAAGIRRMTSGGNGLLVVDVNGVDTYFSFAPVPATGYSIGLVVPVPELQGALLAAQNETRRQVQSAAQAAAVILLTMLIMAVAVSIGLGNLIAAPIQRLTQVASQIAGGDLSVQATSTTNDEIGSLAYAFNTMTARLRETLDGLEHKVAERTAELSSANERHERRARQFESIAQIARTITSTNDLDVLLPQITRVISREFGFYHVGIFMLDSAREYAVLSAANSEGGQIMLKHGHRLKMGQVGIVGHVTGTGTPRVALDTGVDAVFFDNPHLPETRSEMALPLRVGDKIIGALDVQSTEPNAFSQEDISTLSILADQVSIAIQNAEQFEQTRKALHEAESLAKEFSRAGWQQFTSSRKLRGIHHTGARSTLNYGPNGREQEKKVWDPDPAKTKSRGAHLSLPIELRGQVIGSVEVQSPDSRPWHRDELEIVTAIIERAAIALENARLLEESRRLAMKEAKIGEVTSKISASINMRGVLRTAVEELGRALPGSEVMIQFHTDQNGTKATS